MNKLDLLFVVDNSSGMERAQQALIAKLPTFLDALTNGHRLLDESSRFPAALDLHVGLVTTDLGVPGVEHLQGCAADGGDDGRVQHAPRGADCEPVYPPFLSYSSSSPTADIAALDKDLGCIAPVGAMGCDYVQPLEAALKALTPAAPFQFMGQEVQPLTFLAATQDGMVGRGDQLGGARGFVRDDAVLGIIVLTDDDDTSMSDTEAFRPAQELPRDSVYRGQDPKLRAYSNPDSLTPIRRYLALQFSHMDIPRLPLSAATQYPTERDSHPERVVFAAIAGVPSDLVDPQVDYSNDKARNDYYDALMADERMQQQIDDSSDPGSGHGTLVASCTHSEQAQPAYPPRRLVETAREFGASGVIQSICQDDLAPAFGPIVDRLASQLGDACLDEPLRRRSDGSVACEVIWELTDRDYTGEDAPPYECSDREYLKPAAKRRHDRNGNNCSVRQLVVKDADHLPSAQGFYYDDFTPSPENNCRNGRTARIRFTPGVIPEGVFRVVLDCSPEASK